MNRKKSLDIKPNVINWDELRTAHIINTPFSKITTPTNSGTVIIEVNEPNYIPNGFQLRTRIDPFLFTANCDATSLQNIETDSKVVSVAPAQKLNIP